MQKHKSWPFSLTGIQLRVPETEGQSRGRDFEGQNQEFKGTKYTTKEMNSILKYTKILLHTSYQLW